MALEPFRAIPTLADPSMTDLGLWNVFANPDIPGPQAKIRTILCGDQQPCLLSDSILLDRAIARFKTPGLRDLGRSAPYMHNGQFDTLEDIVGFYRGVSDLARGGNVAKRSRSTAGHCFNDDGHCTGDGLSQIVG